MSLESTVSSNKYLAKYFVLPCLKKVNYASTGQSGRFVLAIYNSCY